MFGLFSASKILQRREFLDLESDLRWEFLDLESDQLSSGSAQAQALTFLDFA